MRRHAENDYSPPSKRQRDRSSYMERHSPSHRKSQFNRYKNSNYTQSSLHSSKHKDPVERGVGVSVDNSTRTLCVRKISSKLSSDIVQQYLLREFSKYGDLSVVVGHYNGERTAILNFKYSEDAREALYSKPTIHLHDRTVNVTALGDPCCENDTRKVITGNKRRDDLDHDPDSVLSRCHLMNNITSFQPSAAPSLLGMPGLASSAMMAAAAARALGLNTVPGVLPPPLTNVTAHSRLTHGAMSQYENSRIGCSPGLSDTNPESKATRTLFVGSLEPDITESEVRSAFERYGYVEQIDIKRSPKPGVHCYAFVRYLNVDMASRAKLSMSGRCIRSLHCKIGYGKPILSNCLYIGGLESWSSIESLQRLLFRFGQLASLDWLPGRKYAIATYESNESAFEAHKQLKGLPITGRPNKRLRVDFVNPDLLRSNISSSTNADGHEYSCDDTGQLFNDNRNPSFPHNQTRKSEQFSNESHHYTQDSSTRSGGNKFGRSSKPHVLNARSYPDNRNVITPSDRAPPHLRSVVTLDELDRSLQPDLWRGQFLMKQNYFNFRCLMVIGNREVGEAFIRHSDPSSDVHQKSLPILRVTGRANLDPLWMTEATHRVHTVLSTSEHGLCLMLVLPSVEKNGKNVTPEIISDTKNSNTNNNQLHLLIAYLRLKAAAGIIFPSQNRTHESNKSTDPNSENSNTNSNNNRSAVKDQSFVGYLFAPSNFALNLLQQAAPQLTSDLATANDYMVLMVIKR